MAHRHLDPEGMPAEWGEALTAVQDALSTEAEDECLVCAGVVAVSESGPLVLDRLAGLATGLASALRRLTPEEPTPDTDRDAEPGESGEVGLEDCDRGTVPTHRPAPPTTVRIDVSD